MSGLALALGLQLTVNYVRIMLKERVRDRGKGRHRVWVRDTVRDRDRRYEPDRRSEAINFGINSGPFATV